MNTDGGATKTLLLDVRRRDPANADAQRFWQLNFGRRPSEELYDLTADPDCVVNLADRPETAATRAALRRRLEERLAAEGDLRSAGGAGSTRPTLTPTPTTFASTSASWPVKRSGPAGSDRRTSNTDSIPPPRHPRICRTPRRGWRAPEVGRGRPRADVRADGAADRAGRGLPVVGPRRGPRGERGAVDPDGPQPRRH